MKKLIIKSLLLVLILSICSCTEQQKARAYGGESKVQLPPNTKLINAIWQQSGLWYLYRPIHKGETPETIVFQGSSNFGYTNGKVIFVETLE